MKAPARLLGPPIAVVLLTGVGAAATYDDGDGGEDTAELAEGSTTTRPEGDDGPDAATTSTSIDGATSTSTTSTTTAGGSSTTRPSTTATTQRSSMPTSASPGTTVPPATTAAPATPADLVVHLSGSDVVIVTIENAGPGQAPGITVELSGVPDLQANQLTVGSGVDCFGDGTVTCTVAASGVGGRVGEIEVPLPDGACLVATVVSTVEDPNPGDNSRRRGDC